MNEKMACNVHFISCGFVFHKYLLAFSVKMSYNGIRVFIM